MLAVKNQNHIFLVFEITLSFSFSWKVKNSVNRLILWWNELPYILCKCSIYFSIYATNSVQPKPKWIYRFFYENYCHLPQNCLKYYLVLYKKNEIFPKNIFSWNYQTFKNVEILDINVQKKVFFAIEFLMSLWTFLNGFS